VLSGSRLRSETSRLWLSPQVEAKHLGIQWPEPSADKLVAGVSWGLGWGLEPDAGTFFHWGDNGAFKAFTLGKPQVGRAFVVFTNGASGMAIMPELVANLFPGERPSLRWLGYVSNDAPVRRLFRAALVQPGSEAPHHMPVSVMPRRQHIVWNPCARAQRLVQPRPALGVFGKAEAGGREWCPVIPSDGKVRALTVLVPRA